VAIEGGGGRHADRHRSYPFDNPTTQGERRKVNRDTYLARAEVEAGLVGGRWTKPTEATVIGSKAGCAYPRLPETLWTNWPDSTEPPLGYSVNSMEPVGTEAASLRSKDDAPTE
jgi:hypothetical protein